MMSVDSLRPGDAYWRQPAVSSLFEAQMQKKCPSRKHTEICNLQNNLGYFVQTSMYKLIEAEWRIYASGNYVIFIADNGLSPVRRQAIIWTTAGVLLKVDRQTSLSTRWETGMPVYAKGINHHWKKISEIWVTIRRFSLKKLHPKTSSAW